MKDQTDLSSERDMKSLKACIGTSSVALAFSLVSCTHQKAAKPIRTEERLLSLIADSQVEVHRLEADCVRRQGGQEIVTVAKNINVLNMDSLESGAAVLSTKSDEDLTYLRKLLSGEPPSMSPDMRAARFGSITINGRKVTGGCSLWAAKEARRTVKDLDLAMSVQEKLQKIVRSEDQALPPVKYQWLACLTGETKKITKTRKFQGPGAFRLSFGGDALQVLRRSEDLDKARVALRLLGAQQIDVLAEVQRCQTKVNYLEEFQRVRNASIAKVLNGLDAQSLRQVEQLQP
jgi:hypothetical protein